MSPAASNFNPLPSHEGRPDRPRLCACIKDISIHSPHTRGDVFGDEMACEGLISIHSPHTRGDSGAGGYQPPAENFNPLPSHEGRLYALFGGTIPKPFQSTPLTRGETASFYCPVPRPCHFNPLPSHEGRPTSTSARWRCSYYFNPLPSHEGRPAFIVQFRGLVNFNPLPSHEGRRGRIRQKQPPGDHFNPLPSHEGRR